jgi:hypothetical protein
MPLNPFKEALAKLRQRTPIGADLSSSQWADVPLALRERAFFSARVTNTGYAQQLKDLAESILNPVQERRADRVTPQNPEGFVTTGENLASARAKAKLELQRLAYDPGEKAGGIEDLSSDRRIELQLKQNVESAQGFGGFLQGQSEGALDAFPAQELFRAEDREEPRNWPTRWMQGGGQIFGGRMIALKSDAVWEAISAFGTPYPPFDFNSGMWVRDIDRAEAIDLGLMSETDSAEPVVENFNARLEASVQNVSPDLLQSLQESFGSRVVVEGGRVRWAASASAVPTAPAASAAAAVVAPVPAVAPAAAVVSPAAVVPAAVAAPVEQAVSAVVSKPVSAAFQLPASGQVRASVVNALKAIDLVHDDGTLPTIPVEPTRGKSYLGALHHRRREGGQEAVKISIATKGPWPELTAVHETGHLLDLEAIGAKGSFATDSGAAGTKDVIAALRNTDAVRSLESDHKKAFDYREKRHLDYMLNPKEVWARGYAQFIAEESGDVRLLAQLEKARLSSPGRQWSKADFAPAAQAFRTLFKALNWL